MSWPRFSSGQPTHGVGEFGRTSDFAWLRGDPAAEAKALEKLGPAVRLAMWLFASPVALLAAWLIGRAGVDDMVISAQGWALGLWALVVMALASWQLTSRWQGLVEFRRALLGLLIIATLGIAIGYVYVAWTARAEARPDRPTRALVYLTDGSKMGGLIPAEYGFQFADGSSLGRRKRKRLEYGSCLIVQLLRGPYGFRWVRIVEWMPPPGPGQLHWPVRRDDCFSNIPLSKVRR